MAGELPCAHWDEVFGQAAGYGKSDIASAAASSGGAPDQSAGLLIYTSGTTGEPKGVLLGWHQICANVFYALGALGYEAGWVAGSMLPRFHTFTLISDLLPSLFLGGR